MRYEKVFKAVVSAMMLSGVLEAPGAAEGLSWPPKQPQGKKVLRDHSVRFLKAQKAMKPEVIIAETAPTIDFLYYPGQTYPGNPWSVWGDGTVAGGKYYSAIGDHKAPDGNACVYEYDPREQSLRKLADTASLLDLPSGHYKPGKIHTKVEMGSDGWLYFGTHRGSTRMTTEEYHYKGDWIMRCHPKTGKAEIVVHAPAGKRCIPTGMLDPERLIFYGGTAEADYRDDRVMFFAYDLERHRLLHSSYGGPYRYLIHSSTTGDVYYTREDDQPLTRFHPAAGEPVTIDARLGLRSATRETPQGFVYTVGKEGELWRFDVKNETATYIGSAVVGNQTYITSIDADPTGRYLYYIPGAHGGGYQDGAPVVQFDTQSMTKKVIAFLHPYYKDRYGYVPLGTYSSALSEDGGELYVTWNGNRSGPDRRGRFGFDTCALTVIHIPEEERVP